MCDGFQPQNAYERKIKLMLDFALKRFNGNHTPEQYELELRVAKGILAQLGVNP
jgi:hypothetical protein